MLAALTGLLLVLEDEAGWLAGWLAVG